MEKVYISRVVEEEIGKNNELTGKASVWFNVEIEGRQSSDHQDIDEVVEECLDLCKRHYMDFFAFPYEGKDNPTIREGDGTKVNIQYYPLLRAHVLQLMREVTAQLPAEEDFQILMS